MKNITVNATINNITENELNILNLMFGDRIRFIPDEKKAAPEKKTTQKTTKKTSDNTKTTETKKQTTKKSEKPENTEQNDTSIKAAIFKTCREETTKECVATGKWVPKKDWVAKYDEKVNKAMTKAGFVKKDNKWVRK